MKSTYMSDTIYTTKLPQDIGPLSFAKAQYYEYFF